MVTTKSIFTNLFLFKLSVLTVLLISCNNDSLNQLKGKNGDAGTPGVNGTNGEVGLPGSQGPQGPDSMPWMVDVNGVKIGRFILQSTVGLCIFLVQDNSIACFDPTNGKISSLLVSDFSTAGICYFSTNNCSGTCVAVGGTPIKGSIISVPTGYFRYNGSEVSLGSPLSYQSYMASDGSCNASNGSIGGVPLTPYTLPAGMTFPISVPISFSE